MDLMRLEQLARICGGEVIVGDPSTQVGPRVLIDSRQASPGALFVAFEGERVDGHDYLESARAQGAAAALVQRQVNSALPQIRLDDPVEALRRLGTHVVAEAHSAGELKVIGVTGSSGKTTTKDIAAQLCEALGPTVAPVGSFNNEIGMPLTAALCQRDTRYFVAEMGAQRRGEIELLCSIAPPDVGIVLNVGHAHVGEFGGVHRIVEAKRELVEALGDDGFAVLNFDDDLVWGMREHTAATVVGFSLTQDPQTSWAIWAQDLEPTSDGHRFTLHLRRAGEVTSKRAHLPLAGRHTVADALAAVAAVAVHGAPLEPLVDTLGQLTRRSQWRLAITETAAGVTIVNDAYNANPESMASALETVRSMRDARRLSGRAPRVVAVLADMLELGQESPELHRAVGEMAAFADEVVAVGQHAGDVVQGAGHGIVVPDASEALAWLRENVQPKQIVLLKGSLSMGLGPIGDTLATVLNAGSNS